MREEENRLGLSRILPRKRGVVFPSKKSWKTGRSIRGIGSLGKKGGVPYSFERRPFKLNGRTKFFAGKKQ